MLNILKKHQGHSLIDQYLLKLICYQACSLCVNCVSTSDRNPESYVVVEKIILIKIRNLDI
jgi:hypothetical protein